MERAKDQDPPTPAGYSRTDASEIEAVTILRSLLDSERVRHDLRERDKHPNIDGYIELVDDWGRPLGKIEVQIKPIVAGTVSCRCPSSLVAYSKVATLPVILVGVDRLTSRAYWKQVSGVMPGYDGSQRTFTVHFTEALEAIERGVSCPCYHQWLELVQDYQDRIHRYPLLVPNSGRVRTAQSLTPGDCEALQLYVDTLNRLLDDDFSIVKKLLFPGVWKFGVACRFVDPDYLLYQLSSIPKGVIAPIISELPDSVTFKDFGKNVETTVVQARQAFLRAPAECARDYVLGLVRDQWRARAFHVCGVEMAADVVLGFVERYHRWLEISPDSDEYFLSDLQRAFGPVFSRTTGSVAMRTPESSLGVKVVNLDLIVDALAQPSTVRFGSRETPITYRVSSKIIPIRLAFSSLALLALSGIQKVTRRFRTRDAEYMPPPNNLIWSCYSRERQVANAKAVLAGVIHEYGLFIRANEFRFESSPYLDPTISVAFQYTPSQEAPRGPVLSEWHLRDPHHALEKTLILDGDASNHLKWPVAEINGVRFEVAGEVSRSADFLFSSCPLSTFVYQFLADDLRRQYEIAL